MRPAFAEAAILLAAGAAVLFCGLGRSDLFNPDEPREAEMAREMLVSGDLLVPHLNGEPFLEKPPLFYWLVTPVFRLLGGPGEAAGRLVPAICGLLTVLVTFVLARALLDDRVALLSGLVLLTAFEFFWISRRCMIDMPLTLAILLACAALLRALGSRGGARRLWLLLAYAACGAAVLLKGAVGAGIPALAVVSWLLIRRDGRGVLRLWLVPGGLLALVPIAFWVLRLQERLGAAAAREFVVVNNLLRFTGGAGRGHDNPIWYYLPTLLTDFAPWSLVLPCALLAALRAPVRGYSAPGDPTPREAAPRDLALWVLAPLVVLSLASTKRGIYLLPIYPPAAILVAWWLAGGTRGVAPRVAPGDASGGAPSGAPAGRGRRTALWLLVAALCIAMVVLVAALVLTRAGGAIGPPLAAAALAIPAILAWRAARSADGRRLGMVVAAGAALVEILAGAVLVPAIVNGGASARVAGTDIGRLAQAGDPIVLFGIKEGSLGGLLFYAGRTLPNLRAPEDLARHLGSDPGVGAARPAAVMRLTNLRETAPALPFAVVEARRWPMRTAPWDRAGDNDLVLVVRGP